MKKMKRIISLTVLGLFCLSLPVFAAKNITKDYDFEFSGKDKLSYDAPETIKEKGKKYRLISMTYEVKDDAGITAQRTVKTTDVESKDWPQSIVVTEAGKNYTLVADNEHINWAQVATKPSTFTRTIPSGQQVPSSIKETKEVDGTTIDIEATLTSQSQTSRTETATIPATYTREAENANYTFNGEEVQLQDGGPAWDGYEEAIISGLNLPANASVEGGRWTGKETYSNGTYTRTAEFTVTRPVNYITAVYTETEETASIMQGVVTYQEEGGSKGKAVAHAVYEPAGLPLPAKIAIGAGGAAVAGLITALLFILARKRREEA